MSRSTHVIMNRRDIELSLQRTVLQILERNQGEETIALVGIHTCGVFLAERLAGILKKNSGVKLEWGTLDITLYRDDWSLASQNPLVKTTDIGFDIEGMKVILVDDVVYTGRTIRAAMDALMDYGRPEAIQLATLIDRGGRQLPIQPDYVGMTITVRENERIKVELAEQGLADQVVIED
ncbi:MAG: bifunctional pyr operon transcriptional regulator/uracil phosphoribosyltransferase PyrR [Desulfobulbaceae bacterium]|nr:MAG: bifunctional pyr operon transcriptional regulator/uracil phosphoribosyltransferase PyrR [Desulfobulbaceae bacterium]